MNCPGCGKFMSLEIENPIPTIDAIWTCMCGYYEDLTESQIAKKEDDFWNYADKINNQLTPNKDGP